MKKTPTKNSWAASPNTTFDNLTADFLSIVLGIPIYRFIRNPTPDPEFTQGSPSLTLWWSPYDSSDGLTITNCELGVLCKEHLFNDHSLSLSSKRTKLGWKSTVKSTQKKKFKISSVEETESNAIIATTLKFLQQLNLNINIEKIVTDLFSMVSADYKSVFKKKLNIIVGSGINQFVIKIKWKQSSKSGVIFLVNPILDGSTNTEYSFIGKSLAKNLTNDYDVDASVDVILTDKNALKFKHPKEIQ